MKVFSAIGQSIKHPLKHPVTFGATVLGVYLVGDLIISDKGKSTLGKLASSVMPGGRRHVAPPRPAALPPPPAAPAAQAAQQAAAAGYYAGAFGPGWGRGNMPYLYGPAGTPVGGRWGETPSDISIGHRAWAAAAGSYPEFWNQSSYPWA